MPEVTQLARGGEGWSLGPSAPHPDCWPLHTTSGPSVCGPEPLQTHRCGELMCHACPVELRIGVLGAQNDQCGPCVHPGRTGQAPAEVGVCARGQGKSYGTHMAGHALVMV